MYGNYNNPYYNPNYNMQNTTMGTYPQNNRPIDTTVGHQPISYQQTVQPQVIQGKQVESIDIVKSIEVPFDGSVSYFPVADGSAIVTKQLQMDGTSKITVYKPSQESQDSIEYITREELKNILSDNNKEMLSKLSLDDIEEDIKDLKKQLKKKGE